MNHYNHRKGYKRKYRPNRTETSKKLAYAVTAAFILTAAVSWIAWFTYGDIPEQLLNFTAVPFMIIITGYFSKACIENREKIKTTGGASWF